MEVVVWLGMVCVETVWGDWIVRKSLSDGWQVSFALYAVLLFEIGAVRVLYARDGSVPCFRVGY